VSDLTTAKKKIQNNTIVMQVRESDDDSFYPMNMIVICSTKLRTPSSEIVVAPPSLRPLIRLRTQILRVAK